MTCPSEELLEQSCGLVTGVADRVGDFQEILAKKDEAKKKP